MGTMIDYIKEYGNVVFAEKPMNEVDSLVLCQLSYLKFDCMVPGVAENAPFVSLEELKRHEDYEKLFVDVWFEKENRELFEALLTSRRYKKLRLNCHINMVEKEWETQFSAVTFLLDDGTLYVAFRGTDESIVGWKEDFNMAFLYPVPGQALSVKYLNMVTSKFYKPFYIGGHSKGGNLAVYSAMNCLPKIQERIIKIYNMDGPGFRPEILEQCRYNDVADKVVKILPHSSLVGMIFEKDIRYKVVESKTFGLAQHNPFTWMVKDGSFVEVDGIYEGRRRMNDALNEWILSLDEKRIKEFVDTLYHIISASEANDLIEFAADWRHCLSKMRAAFKEVDEETSEMLKETVKSLFHIITISMTKEIKTGFNGAQRKKHISRK